MLAQTLARMNDRCKESSPSIVMKPLQNFGEDTMILHMLLKLIKHLEMLFIYRLVGNSCEIDVSLVSATPLVNGVLDLEN
jgi:hypothetical protein